MFTSSRENWIKINEFGNQEMCIQPKVWFMKKVKKTFKGNVNKLREA